MARVLAPFTAALALALAGCGGEPSAPAPPAAASSLTVRSPAFTDGGTIPREFTCAGAGHRPALTWDGDVHDATTLAVVVDDPDAPGGDFYHWVVVDLPLGTNGLAARVPGHEIKKWTPPCPPSGTHHYRFTVYGLSRAVGGGSLADALAAIDQAAVARGRLTGLVSH